MPMIFGSPSTAPTMIQKRTFSFASPKAINPLTKDSMKETPKESQMLPIANPTTSSEPSSTIGTSKAPQAKISPLVSNSLMSSSERSTRFTSSDRSDGAMSDSPKTEGHACDLTKEELQKIQEQTANIQSLSIERNQHASKKMEDMNADLLEACEKLKELSVRLYLLNNEVLFMNSPILLHQLDENNKDPFFYQLREE
eukprot:TRINITY_DN6763_c0_g1_i2.p1 TRINITY_DN6763_c0_g1~~TRINITY_DN6763_c0_g1_i2.p1  ORF type:complete len:198 (-),score=63.82 TRINITY_DN6763_c0_g1_i2:7-600(-)